MLFICHRINLNVLGGFYRGVGVQIFPNSTKCLEYTDFILYIYIYITIYMWKNGKADLDMNCLFRNSRNISLSYLFITISHSFGARSGREKLIFLKTGSNSRILQTTDTALGIMKTYFISYWSEPGFGLEPRSDTIYY